MKRGFTLIELAICISVGTLLVPVLFGLGRASEKQHLRALAQVEAAHLTRTVSEELRRDLQSLRMVDGPAVVLEGACGKVEYGAQGGVLVRRADAACGGTRALGKRVKALRRDGARAAVLEFDRAIEPGVPANSSFRIAW